VRGTAASSVGVQGVTVAGIAATSGDGFATWEANVPLPIGDLVLDVVATDALGAQTSLPGVTVTRVGAVPVAPRGIAFDAAADRIYVADPLQDVVLAYDEGTKASWILTGPTVGAGPALVQPEQLALDVAGDRLYVGETSSSRVLRVDLATGDRAIVTDDSGTGNGPSLGNVTALGFDPSTKVVYVLATYFSSVFAVDTQTGNRTLVTGPGVGQGPTWAAGHAADLAVDSAGSRLLVTCVAASAGLYSVDLATGDRVLLSGTGVGQGPTYSSQMRIVFDEAAGRCYTSNSGTPASFLSIDLATGDRTAIPYAGPFHVRHTSDVALDAGKGRLIVSDDLAAGVRDVEVVTGNRSEIWRPRRGTGPYLESVYDVGYVPGDAQACLFDLTQSGALDPVDLATGDVTALWGSGSPLDNPGGMQLDAANGRAVALGWTGTGYGVGAIDLVTGDRTLLSGEGLGTGPALPWSASLALDAAAGRLYVADMFGAAIIGVDLASGDRFVVADAVTGTGDWLTEIHGLAWDDAEGRIYASGIGGVTPTIVAVVPSTGDRTTLADDVHGTGSNAFYARSIVIDPFAHRLLVDGYTELLAVDLSTGDRTTAAAYHSDGPCLSGALQAIVPTGLEDVFLVAEDSSNALYLLDLASGDRLIVSR
jgi:DNA-binding beta-propeller fold protein YncE